jgi:hypothetical protein
MQGRLVDLSGAAGLGADQIQILEGHGGLGTILTTMDMVNVEGVGLEEMYEGLGAAQLGGLRAEIKDAFKTLGKAVLKAACNLSGPLLVQQCNRLTDSRARAACVEGAERGANLLCDQFREIQAVEEAESSFARSDEPNPTSSSGVLLLRPTSVSTKAALLIAQGGADGSAPTKKSSPVVPVAIGLTGVGLLFMLARGGA